MEEKVKFLELEDADAELRNLQHRDRENQEDQEGETLMALLRSDMDICTNERLVHDIQNIFWLLYKLGKQYKLRFRKENTIEADNANNQY